VASVKRAAGAISDSVVGKAVLTLYPPLRPLSHNVNPRDGAQDIALLALAAGFFLLCTSIQEVLVELRAAGGARGLQLPAARTTAVVSTCEVLRPPEYSEYVLGLARGNATQVREFQNNRRCPLNIENEFGRMSRSAHPGSCDEPHGEATDSRSTWNFGSGPCLANPEIRYGENGGKKSGCLRRSEGEMAGVCVPRIPWGGGGGGPPAV
jgi:hypothetical protein